MDEPSGGEPSRTDEEAALVKTTLSNRPTANPRRTTLVHLADTADLTPEAGPVAESVVLPTQTANPRRTTLVDLPDA
ncbi:hypothetical protein [Streptomyces spiramenti]|uniref:hypothetical protein n=1 Tax=Streptomyces spiramenti TaxID=2720606 RepID=UPI00143C52DB|nr:hypothetical protein [Streptomyces spiramenti]